MRHPGSTHIVTSARAIGRIGSDRGDLLLGWDLFRQVGQHECTAGIACHDADRADLPCFLVHTEVQLAPQAFPAPAKFARVPLSFSFRFDPGCVDRQVQGTRPSATGGHDAQRLPAATQRAEVPHFPVEPSQPQRAFNEPRRLPRRHCARTNGAAMTTVRRPVPGLVLLRRPTAHARQLSLWIHQPICATKTQFWGAFCVREIDQIFPKPSAILCH